MLKPFLLRALFSLSLLVLLYSAWLSWQSAYLVSKIKHGNLSELIEEFNQGGLPILLMEPVKELLYRAQSQPDVDAYAALELLDEYLHRRPLDANGWLIGSRFYQRVGDYENASGYLSVAHRLSETNIPILFKVFNHYLELGLIDEAMPVAHDIVVARPKEFRRLFYLLSRLSEDYVRIVDEVIPKYVSSSTNLDSLGGGQLYFNWALVDAIKVKNTLLAKAVWQAMPQTSKRNNKFGLRLLNYLIRESENNYAKNVWFDLLGKQPQVGEVNEMHWDAVSPCWSMREVSGVEASFDVLDLQINSIKLKFLGENNIAYNHLSCLVLVESDRQYTLSGRSKGEDISTLSGLFVDIIFPGPGSKKSIVRSDALIGSWPWTNFELNFKVPAETMFAVIRVRRSRTNLLDSKISGSVWFSGFTLDEMAPKTEGVINE